MVFLLAFSTIAHANGGNTFRLVLQDTTTGVQRVITDNQTLGGIFNPDGDKSNVLGTIQFNSSVGNFFVTLTATSTTDASGAGTLSVTANVSNQSTSSDQFVVFLEDVYSTNGAAATLTNTVSGATLSSTATLSGQSWLDSSGLAPSFGANTGQATIVNPNGAGAISGTGVIIPADNPYNLVGLGSTSVIQGAPSSSMVSEAVVQFTGAGTANFTFTASDPTPMPEPTSLMLLGSSLLAAGVLRKRK
jgi:hypothetical protein